MPKINQTVYLKKNYCLLVMSYFFTFKISYLNKSVEQNSEVYAEIRTHSYVVKNVRVVKETETRCAQNE